MPNNLKVVTITLGGVTYTAKATIGMYAKACEIAGVDLSVLFEGNMPPSKLVVAFAQQVSGMNAEQINDVMMMADYPAVIEAMMVGVVPEIGEKSMAQPTPTPDDAPKN